MVVDAGDDLELTTALELHAAHDVHLRFCVCAHLTPRATARPVCEAFLAAMTRYGVPEQVLTDNGKVFTARFGRGSGIVLYDRLCRENGVRHLLTAPRSPTTTGKVERFHKTVRKEFLLGRVFSSIEEAQAALDEWVESYNSERPHQGIGMTPPLRRFELADEAPPVVVPLEEEAEEMPPALQPLTRLVSARGRVSFEGTSYHVGVWLAGEAVELVCRDGLLEASHRDVLIACHARRRTGTAQAPLAVHPRLRAARPASSGPPVVRKVDPTGYVSFAATGYFVSSRMRGEQVEVRIVGDTVEISQGGKLLRTWPARHDRSKEHGAFSTPKGRPERINAAQYCTGSDGTHVPEPRWNTGGET